MKELKVIGEKECTEHEFEKIDVVVYACKKCSRAWKDYLENIQKQLEVKE